MSDTKEMQNNPLLTGLELTVQQALAEDIGTGDITADLINESTNANAKVICREKAVICGQPWVNEVFRQIDPHVEVEWNITDGQIINESNFIFTAKGSAKSILTAERSALNFLQTLSSTATESHHLAELVKQYPVKILDTRKTIPGLRNAQKYAVQMGGASNHRIGLYDAFLIKENHINASGGITQAVLKAKNFHNDKPVEVEVETTAQLEEAITAGADIVMLDNFNLAGLFEAVEINQGRVKLEASGGYDSDSIVAVAQTGVNYISVGSLTKHCKATDFSMLFD